LDSDHGGCSHLNGVRQPTVTPHWPSEFTYQLKLTMGYKPGRYKLLINSLFAEQCASFAVTK
jgi:hypothetical protein